MGKIFVTPYLLSIKKSLHLNLLISPDKAAQSND